MKTEFTIKKIKRGQTNKDETITQKIEKKYWQNKKYTENKTRYPKSRKNFEDSEAKKVTKIKYKND